MFNSGSMPSLSDIAAVTGNNRDGNGFMDGNSCWWILIVLFFCVFGGFGGGWNNGYGNGGGYVATAATQADIQRGFDNQSVMNKLNGLENGLCDGFYAMNTAVMTGTNQVQNAIQQASTANLQNTYMLQQSIQADTVANMQNTNTLASQLANCCCENREAIAQVRYDMATDTCAVTTAINQAAQNIMTNCNNNYRQLHDEIVANQIAAKDAKIAEQQAMINALNLAASQQAQNAYLVEQMKRCNANTCCGSASC
uniref:Uncharacterized protein n=1 Tax=Siphoviridae sp. ctgBD49 TaxID=2826420 RepID=A0A8S5QNW4_9CAUD|nr:MAG TPA: hypothetical protein [Siphoviridae sp. ctgBD49]